MRVLVNFFKELVHAVRLIGSDTWVVNPRIGRMLGGFHHRVACRLIGKQPQRIPDGIWEQTPLGEGNNEAGLKDL